MGFLPLNHQKVMDNCEVVEKDAAGPHYLWGEDWRTIKDYLCVPFLTQNLSGSNQSSLTPNGQLTFPNKRQMARPSLLSFTKSLMHNNPLLHTCSSISSLSQETPTICCHEIYRPEPIKVGQNHLLARTDLRDSFDFEFLLSPCKVLINSLLL